jgi:flagellar assembly protein FliH
MLFERTTTQKSESRTEPFTYLPTSDGTGVGGTTGNGASDWNAAPSVSPEVLLEQREKQGYERGLQEGEARTKKAAEQTFSAERVHIARAVEEFKVQRESYFNRIEPEVVQLALSIARKILHREAQMDPLLLAGMVHVALEKVEQGTRVRLRAHPDEIYFWNRHFSEEGALAISPEIIGDPTLQHGECALETEIGSTQICLDTQLKEIEQGFFDLLEHRPAVR